MGRLIGVWGGLGAWAEGNMQGRAGNSGWLFSASIRQSWASALKCWAPRLCCWICLLRQLNLFSSPDLLAIHADSSIRGYGLSPALEHTAKGVVAWNRVLLAWMDKMQVRPGVKPHSPLMC